MLSKILNKKLVATFTIAGYTVEEFIDDEGCDRLHDGEAHGYTATFDDGRIEIGYRSALGREHLGRVRQHEWLHAICFVYGINEGAPFTHELLDLLSVGLDQIQKTYTVEPDEEETPKPKRKKGKKK